MPARLCMMCDQPLNGNGDCTTTDCIYNPGSEGEVHDAEFDYVEGRGDTQTDEETFDFGDLGLTPEEMEELANEGKDLPEAEDESDEPMHSDDLTPEEREQMWEQNKNKRDNLDSKTNQDAQDADDRMGGGDEGDMDTSEVEAGEEEIDAENDPEDSKGQLDTTEELEQQTEKQLTEEDKGEDPSDDAHDLPQDEQQDDPGDPEDDEGLPPRPRGCNGDCKPSDDPGGDDDEPCPHCTAKQFRDQMRNEGKEQMPEEQMEQEWQDFLDNWEKEAEESQGDSEEPLFGESEVEKNEINSEDRAPDEQGYEGDGEQEAPEDYVPDPEDDDLPPRPQGCSGNCEENDDPDGDGEPCPHCTAKRFKQDLRDQQEEGQELPDADELAEMFQQMLDEQREQMKQEPKDEPEPEPEDSDEDDFVPCDQCGENMVDPSLKREGEDTVICDNCRDGDDEPKDEEKKEKPKRQDFVRKATDLTITQEKRFDNLVQRLQKKVEGTFGNTAEEVFVMPKTEGQFDGEDISQAIQIRSRGVLYWCTLSAAKDVED